LIALAKSIKALYSVSARSNALDCFDAMNDRLRQNDIDEEEPRQYSSPACFMHEFAPSADSAASTGTMIASMLQARAAWAKKNVKPMTVVCLNKNSRR